MSQPARTHLEHRVPSLISIGVLLAGALLLWARWWTAGGAPVVRQLQAGASPLHPPCAAQQGLVLPTEYGGVHRYSIPGQWLPSLPSAHQGNRTGTLHLYLKALRWLMPDGSVHLRARGFVAFEVTGLPEAPGKPYTFRNPPEVAAQLRLFVRSNGEHAWEREVAVEFAYSVCAWGMANPKGFNYQACLEREQAQAGQRWEDLGLVDIDFGPSGLYFAAKAPSPSADFSLLVHGWPRSISLKAQLQAALAAPLAPVSLPEVQAQPPRLLRALPYLSTVDISKTARLLEWTRTYYAALGFDGFLMYVLPKDVVDMEAHSGIRALIADGWLRLARWDELLPVEGWKDSDLQIVETHPVLSLWGTHTRVMVGDIDEFLIPGTPGDTLPAMLDTGCLAGLPDGCLIIPRWDVFPNKTPQKPRPDEPSWWKDSSGPCPLHRYKYQSQRRFPPKVMVDPNKAFPISVHFSSVCGGASGIADGPGDKLQSCGTRSPCVWADKQCAWVAHVGNMHKARRDPVKGQPIKPKGWLWMLDEADTATERAK